MNTNCLPDEQLLAMASGDPGSAETTAHVEQCAECQDRLRLLKGEIAELQSFSSFLASTVLTTAAANKATFPLANATTIGRYVIVASLGSGGQADVYRVVDPDLGRYLVLKLSHVQSSDDDERRSVLLSEGRLLAELEHPGLIRIYDVGIFHGHPYLVLEHVPGRNLEQIFAEKRPSANEAARLIAEVAQVVAYAHRRGVVHGDITPRNILIDAHGRTRLIDFGLSNIENAWGEKAVVSGGTPDFLPPEIVGADGRLKRAGTASDVFGLGATLYWLLTGKAPFAATSITESLERARRCDVDFAALRQAQVPRRLVRVCQQAMEADPAHRPSPDVLSKDLQRASRRWITSRLVIAAVVAMILTSGGFFLWLNEWGEPSTKEGTNFIHSTPAVSVFRPDGIRTLSNELPLRTGDRVAVSCNISQGHEAIVLWFTAAGELKMLTPVRDITDRIDRLVYPAPRRSIVLEPPEGTELIFFCRGGPVDPDDLRACFPKDATIPVLPAQNWLALQRSEVRIEGPLKSEIPDEILKIEGSMKEINRQLRKHFQSVTGIAFPHREVAETPQ